MRKNVKTINGRVLNSTTRKTTVGRPLGKVGKGKAGARQRGTAKVIRGEVKDCIHEGSDTSY